MKHLVLDLEHTLIGSALDEVLQPRPGLMNFLEWAATRFGEENITIFSVVPHNLWSKVAKRLVEDGHAPWWFADLRFMRAERPKKTRGCRDEEERLPIKDLRRVCVDIEQTIIVDDFWGFILPEQRHRWIQTEPWLGEEEEDRELERVRLEIDMRLTIAHRNTR